MKRVRLIAGVVIVAVVAAACNYAYAPFLSRVDGPVVLTAADLNVETLNLDPGRGIGFRWNADTSSWVQIPIQIDERHVVDFGVQPNNNTAPGVTGTIYGSGNDSGVTALQFSDPDTWVGADPNTTFDADDELVFLARDAGPQAPAGVAHPAAAIGGIGREIALADPDGGTAGYVYLFYGGAGVDPTAGVDHVTYDFSLDGGTYKDDYLRANGPNPESSSVTTDRYTMGFGDRWITDELSSSWGTGVDILDGHKARFSLSTCGRSNVTFADAEGAFVANIDGPVRAIRDYIGANSGPLTQRREVFYEDRYEQVTDLRVHAISGIMGFFDWSAAASGMTYGRSGMSGTVTVDGNPDTVPSSVATWEYLTGSQASLTITGEVTTSASLATSGFYLDDDDLGFAECWGDDGDYVGAAGQQFTGGIPNTDPRSVPFDTFQSRVIVGFWPTGLNSANWTPGWAADALQPLDVTVSNI